MTKFPRLVLLACLLLASTADRASASILYTLTDVNLVVGNTYAAGSLTGTFTLSDDRQTLEAIHVTASGATVNGFTYAPTTYTLADATYTYTDQVPYNFRVNLGATRSLQLVFVGGLSELGITNIFNGTSYEWQNTAGSRTVASGWVVASNANPVVPEPSTLLLGAAGFPALLVALRRRRPAA